MNDGFFKIYRSLSDNPIWTLEPFTKGQAWVDLLMIANFARGEINVRGNIVIIERGQVGWSEVGLSKRWKWSRSKVRTFIKYLESRQQIEQQKNTISSIISITNYDHYQDKDSKKNSTETAEGQQKDTKKKDKKEKKEDICPECISKQLWNDWKKHRGSKAPITETVIKGFEREAETAGITLEAAVVESIERNWRGFKAEWYPKEKTVVAGNSSPKLSDEAYAKLLEQTSGGKRNV